MATRRYIIFVAARRVESFRLFVFRHQLLDRRSGGNLSLPLPLGITVGGAVVARGTAGWKLPDAHGAAIFNELTKRGWSRDTPSADFAFYNTRNWSLQAALDDVTRKPVPLVIIPSNLPPPS